MPQKTLIITNTAGFGVLIQQTLEDTGRYSVSLISFANLTTTPERADVIIVDMDYGTGEGEQLEKFADLTASLQFAYPEAVFILVPPLNDFNHPIVERLKPAGLLTKPFYLPELVEVVDGLLNKPAPEIPAETDPIAAVRVVRKNHPEPPAWLQDVSRAAQYLARLSLESSAQAALIVRGDVLWAYAGQMTQPEVQELTRIVISYRASQTKPLSASQRNTRSDLARYSRLPTSGKEVMVYVTALAEGLQLVLAYDASTPFSMIRMQANHLARVLATSPDGLESAAPNGQHSTAQQGAEKRSGEQRGVDLQSALSVSGTDDHLPAGQHSTDNLSAEWPPVDWQSGGNGQSSFTESDDTHHEPGEPQNPSAFDSLDVVGNLPPDALPLMENIPPFSPRQASAFNTTAAQADPYPAPIQKSAPAGHRSSTQTNAPAVDQSNTQLPDREPASPQQTFDPLGAFESAVPVETEGLTPVYENLLYACMLAPRMPNHYLTGDLAFRLGEMLPQLCLAYGWRLDHLSIHLDHVLWSVRASANTAPIKLIRVARQSTSRIIFEDFPSLGRDNPSGDFWAPGHLLINSANLPPEHLIRDFLKQTRLHQINPRLQPPLIRR